LANKKNIWDKLGRKENNYFLPFAIIVTVPVLIWVAFLSKSSIVNWVRSRAEITRQERAIKKYESEIKQMDEEIQSLQMDKDSLEKYGRETFNLAAPGDDVYIIE